MGESLEIKSNVESSSEFEIEISRNAYCLEKSDSEAKKSKASVFGPGTVSNTHAYNVTLLLTLANHAYFKVCPKSNGTEEIKGSVFIKSALHGYSTYERPYEIEYHYTLCWLFGILWLIWMIIMSESKNASYPHKALSGISMLFTMNQIGMYLAQRNYDLYADSLSFRPEVTISNFFYAIRNTALLLWGMQASSGFGILYTEWTPLTFKQKIISGGYFILDLSTLIALQFSPQSHDTHCLHNYIAVFRRVILISAVLIYSSFNFAEMAESNESIGLEVKAAYSKLSNFIALFMTIISASLTYCIYRLNNQPDDVLPYFWFIQDGWTHFAGLCFLTTILFFYRPKASLAKGFYKNANLTMGSECESFKSSARSEFSQPLV